MIENIEIGWDDYFVFAFTRTYTDSEPPGGQSGMPQRHRYPNT